MNRTGFLGDRFEALAAEHHRGRKPRSINRWSQCVALMLAQLSGRHYTFVTNLWHLAATTIAAIYKERWQVELFFKSIKQNLRIRAFLGTSLNAVLTQIWIALCTYLLLGWLKFMARLGWSLQQILCVLQLNLFLRRDLFSLLYGDSRDQCDEPSPPQLRLV